MGDVLRVSYTQQYIMDYPKQRQGNIYVEVVNHAGVRTVSGHVNWSVTCGSVVILVV